VDPTWRSWMPLITALRIGTMPSETLTSCWTTLGERLGCAWREADAESADRAALIRDLPDV
jgi:hypothetical protein